MPVRKKLRPKKKVLRTKKTRAAPAEPISRGTIPKEAKPAKRKHQAPPTKKAQPAQRRKRPATAAKATKPKVEKRERRLPHILIIECDPNGLKSDKIMIASDLVHELDVPELKGRVRHVAARNDTDLCQAFANFATEKRRFEIVAVIGHGTPQGLALFSRHRDVPWNDFGGWIAPFRPEQLLLYCCHGGKWANGFSLFRKVKSLKAVWGTPTRANASQLHVLTDVLRVLAAGGRPDAVARSLVNAFRTQGLVVRWTKSSLPPKYVPLQVFAEHLLDKHRDDIQRLAKDATDLLRERFGAWVHVTP